jgi:hypothetical protein
MFTSKKGRKIKLYVPSITQVLNNPVMVIAILVFGAFIIGLLIFFVIMYFSMNNTEASEEDVAELLALKKEKGKFSF